MLIQHKILAEKYEQVHNEAPANIGGALKNVYQNLAGLADTAQGKEASAAFNQLLLSLLNSSDGNVVAAATNVLNKQPQVAKEEDEPIAGSGDDNTTGVTGTGF